MQATSARGTPKVGIRIHGRVVIVEMPNSEAVIKPRVTAMIKSPIPIMFQTMTARLELYPFLKDYAKGIAVTSNQNISDSGWYSKGWMQRSPGIRLIGRLHLVSSTCELQLKGYVTFLATTSQRFNVRLTSCIHTNIFNDVIHSTLHRYVCEKTL